MRHLIAASLLLAACSDAALPGCPEGTLLSGGLCRPRCESIADCLTGELCAGGVCVGDAPDDAGADDSGARDAGGRDAEAPDLGTIACTRDMDCGRPTMTEWSDCTSMAGPCAFEGEQFRELTRPACNAGTCQFPKITDRQNCMIMTEGKECAPSSITEFSECKFDTDCAERGIKSRELTTHICSRGQCNTTVTPEHVECTRSTTGDTCPPYMDEEIGECFVEDLCSGGGHASSTIRTWICRAESCMPDSVGTMMVQCIAPPAPDGTSCAPDAQCCAGLCTGLSDPANCGVCGMACDNNRQCVSLGSSGPGSRERFACECEVDANCRLYGSNGYCNNFLNPPVCGCECPGLGPCAGQCVSGMCFEGMFHGICTYP